MPSWSMRRCRCSMEPEFVQSSVVRINQCRLPCIQVKVERCKAGLRLPCLASMTESLVAYTFVKSADR